MSKKETPAITSKTVLSSFLKSNKEDHYNFEKEVDYRVSSGSLNFDLELGGGFGPGLHRFTGMNEGGKEQRVSAPVLTPNGWVKIGDLKVGDLVIDSHGNQQTVLGIFPQGLKDDYEVEFDDGSKVNCGIEHLWETSSFSERHSKSGQKASVKNLQYIIDTLKYGKNLNHSVRLVEPIKLTQKEFLIDPYLLGVLIGDACLIGKVDITNTDQEIWSKVSSVLENSFNGDAELSARTEITKSIIFPNRQDNPLITKLKKLNLFNKKSDEKFIPQEFLLGSIPQRISLLQGLVDTDGYINPKKSEVLYYTTSEQLANDLCSLVRSLGGLARYRFRNGAYKNKDGLRVHCKKCYIVSFYLPKGISPSSLTRKMENYSLREINFHHFIKSVTKVGQEESVCIKVSSPDSLYVTSDYVLTHNTSASLEVMRNFLLSVPNSKGFYIKAEGRLSKEMKERSGLKFVFTPEEWEVGTCFVFESNIYETVVDALRELITKNEEGIKYCFVLDSVDGLIRKDDLNKSFDESAKVAGGAVIASDFMKKLSIALAKRGHMAIFISQVRADIKLDPYSKAPIRQTSATGGNALLHFANWIIEFEPRFQSDWILQDPTVKKKDDKTNPIIGHNVKITIKKSPNEKTNMTIYYPIRYHRKNGTSIWIEKELVDMLLSWELVEKGGSWMKPTEDLQELLQENGLEPMEKTQGANGLFSMIEERKDLSKFLYRYFVDLISK